MDVTRYGVTPLGVVASLLMGLGGFTLFLTGWAVSVRGTTCQNPDICEALGRFFPFSLALFLSGVGMGALGFLFERRMAKSHSHNPESVTVTTLKVSQSQP